MMAVIVDTSRRGPVGGKIMASLRSVITFAESHQKSSNLIISYILLDIT